MPDYLMIFMDQQKFHCCLLMHQDTVFIHSCFIHFCQRDHEIHLTKVENEGKNLERKLRDDLQQLQNDLDNEKVSIFTEEL